MNNFVDPEDSKLASRVGQAVNDFLERTSRGEHLDVEEYANRHPEITEVLRQLLPAVQMLGVERGDETSVYGNKSLDHVESTFEARAKRSIGEIESPPGYELLEEVGRGGIPVGPRLRHQDVVRDAIFSPDGHKILTCSDDKTARLWNVPKSLPNKSKQIQHWLQLATGMELTQRNELIVLDAETWHKRRTAYRQRYSESLPDRHPLRLHPRRE